MLDNVFGFFEKLVLNFTWTRFTFLLSCLILLVAALATFEFYTGHFRLNRLEREVKLLEQLVEVSKKVESVPRTEPSRPTFERMLRQFDDQLSQPSVSFGQMPALPYKVLYGALPWLILGLIVLLTTSTGRGSALLGMAFVAIPLIVLGANLPTFQADWINNYAYPWGSMVFVVLSILYVQRRRRAS